MGIEGWMITIVILIATFISGYAVLKAKVNRLAQDFKDHLELNSDETATIHKRIDSGFKRVDEQSNKITILERDTSTHMDLPTAEQKFVTRRELELHLDKIEVITGNTNQQVSQLMGKQNEILTILSEIKQ